MFQVLVLRAMGLRAADLNGKSDPYVIAKAADKQAKTGVIKRNLDPVWNEEVYLDGKLSSFLETGLTLQVYDKDRITRDDFLGEVKVPLHELRTRDRQNYTEPISSQGTILFSVKPEPKSTWPCQGRDSNLALFSRAGATSPQLRPLAYRHPSGHVAALKYPTATRRPPAAATCTRGTALGRRALGRRTLCAHLSVTTATRADACSSSAPISPAATGQHCARAVRMRLTRAHPACSTTRPRMGARRCAAPRPGLCWDCAM